MPWNRSFGLKWAVVVALGGLVITVLGTSMALQSAQQADEDAFDHLVELALDDAQVRLGRAAYGLAGARGAIAATGAPLSAEGFRRYFRSRDLPREFPGVTGLGMIVPVARAGLAEFEAVAAGEYDGQFRIHDIAEDTHATALIIRSIEPQPQNRNALGLDIGSEPRRRAAAERAVRDGIPVATAPIRLVQDPQGRPGTLFLLPVFASGGFGRASADDAVVALVYAAMTYPVVLDGMAGEPGSELLSIRLYDTGADAADRLVYASDDADMTAARFLQRAPITFGGRPMEVVAAGTPRFEATRNRSTIWAAAALGLLVTLLATSAAARAGRRHAEALGIAEEMTADLRRLAKVAELTQNAVFVADASNRIVWNNPAYQAWCGTDASLAAGRLPDEPQPAEGDDYAAFAAARQAGRPFRGILRFRDAATGDRWADVEIQPMAVGEGHGAGYIQVMSDVTSARRQARRLAESESFLREVSGMAGVGGWRLDVASGELQWSEQTRRIHGVQDDFQPTVENGIAFYSGEAQDSIRNAVTRAMAQGTPWDLELRLDSHDGRRLWVRAVGHAERSAGRTEALVGALQDVTAQVEERRRIDGERALLATTLRCIGDAVVTADADGRITWLNPVAESLTGWTTAAANGLPSRDVLRLEVEGMASRPPCPIEECLKRCEPVGLAGGTELVCRDGSRRLIEDSCSPLFGEDSQVLGAVMVFHDVTEKARLAREMDYRARHDALTGLLNRGEFERALEYGIERARGGGREGALLFVDLDHFKMINDSCGHLAGDSVLREVASILVSQVRSLDTIARFGGDEFAILLEGCPLSRAEQIADEICRRVDAYRFQADDGHRYRVGASIGLVPVDGRWPNTSLAIQAVDAACYAAKGQGRNRVVVQEGIVPLLDMPDSGPKWGARIEAALDGDGFRLMAQRIVPLAGNDDALRCEVLLRMIDEGGKVIGPNLFMPAAERYQLASRIDRWVLRAVLDRLACHPDPASLGKIGVNLSGQSVGDRAFHRFALEAIAGAGIPPRVLCIEITETAAVTNFADASLFIEALRELGVQVALDDFGAGAASFGYLRALQVDLLKIDGQFVRDLLGSPLNQVAVRSFVDVAATQSVRVVAEHVEDAATARRLAEMGVEFGQGYLFHRPEPFEAVLAASPVHVGRD